MHARGIIWSMRAGNKLRRGAASYILLKNAIRVVEVGDDKGKTGEVIGQLGRERAAAGKETSQCARFDGTHGVGKAASESELGDVRIAEHFEASSRELLPRGGEHW